MYNKKEKFDTTKIAGLLNYGVFWGESKKKIIIIYCFILVLYLLLLVLTIVMLTIEQIKAPSSNLSFAFYIILYSIIFSLLPVILAILVIKNERMRKKVNLWIEDAVLVEAYAKNIGVKRPLGVFQSAKIRVDFEIEGIHYSRESQSRNYKNNNFEQGYYLIWSKYADNYVNILYSKKYDEVMILKNN